MTRCSWWSRRALALALLSLSHLLLACFPLFFSPSEVPARRRLRSAVPSPGDARGKSVTSGISASSWRSSASEESDRIPGIRACRPFRPRRHPPHGYRGDVAIAADLPPLGTFPGRTDATNTSALTSSPSPREESTQFAAVAAHETVVFNLGRRSVEPIAAAPDLLLHRREHPRNEGECAVLLDILSLSLLLCVVLAVVPHRRPSLPRRCRAPAVLPAWAGLGAG